MLLARGDVQERAFGLTMAMLARKYGSGQLSVVSRGATYEVVFRAGIVVAARSPHPEDRLSQIGVARGWLADEAARVIDQVRTTSPDADELDMCVVLGELDAETASRLHRRAVTQRAGRMVGLETGTYTFSSSVSLTIRDGSEIHIGGVLYQGALLHVSEQRLEDIVSRLGSRFEMPATNAGELEYLGFGKAETPIVRALLEGVTFDRLTQLGGVEAPYAYASVYALVACGLAVASPRLARGTRDPMFSRKPAADTASAVAAQPERAGDESAAAAAFERGELALRAERIADAIVELEYAVGLVPTEKRYTTALAWAKFCGAIDKNAAASAARQVLSRVAAYHDGPVEAHYYLGLLERMVERPARAEEHFRAVLDRMPNHVEAATELRFLARRRR